MSLVTRAGGTEGCSSPHAGRRARMGCCSHSLPCMLARPAGVQSASSAAFYATNTASAGPQRVDRFDEPWRTIGRDRHRRLEPALAQNPQHPFRLLPGSHYWSLRESGRPSTKPHRGPRSGPGAEPCCLCVRLTRYCPLGHTGGSFVFVVKRLTHAYHTREGSLVPPPLVQA
jgi:hypothetical protein